MITVKLTVIILSFLVIRASSGPSHGGGFVKRPR